MNDLVAVSDVSHAYESSYVLRDINLNIDSSTFVGLIGPSGSGKTTLLKILLGTLRPSVGTVKRNRNASIAYVPQTGTVNWDFPITVEEVILMSMKSNRRRGWGTTTERRTVRILLTQLGLEEIQHRHIRELSGGQQQRVFTARALARKPDLLVLDEPTSGVDVKTRHDIVHLLGELHAEGMSIVLTTHDINGLAAHLPQVACINKEILSLGKPREVLTPTILEKTYGAAMTVLEHGGMFLVTDAYNNHASHEETK